MGLTASLLIEFPPAVLQMPPATAAEPDGGGGAPAVTVGACAYTAFSVNGGADPTEKLLRTGGAPTVTGNAGDAAPPPPDSRTVAGGDSRRAAAADAASSNRRVGEEPRERGTSETLPCGGDASVAAATAAAAPTAAGVVESARAPGQPPMDGDVSPRGLCIATGWRTVALTVFWGCVADKAAAGAKGISSHPGKALAGRNACRTGEAVLGRCGRGA